MKFTSRLFTATRVFAVAAFCFTLTSCGGSKPKGTYVDATGVVSIDFDGSNAKMKMPGVPDVPAEPYTVDGKTIKMKDGSTMTINDDGSLTAPGGIKLIKK